MALNSNGKSRHILEKILPSGKNDTKKAGASKKKKSKRKEIKLEALSVSENFDPETYIIPLQNRWTIESELSRASDVSNNEEKYLITRRPIDDSVGQQTLSKASKKTNNNGRIVTAQIFENPSKDESTLPKKVSRSLSRNLKKDKVGISKSDPYSLLKNLDGINGIGYVPSHPKLKQRSSENEAAYASGINGKFDGQANQLQDSWTVQVQQSDSPDSMSGSPSFVNGNSIQRPKNEADSKIESIVLLHDKITSMPGMVDNEKAIDDFSDLDIDRVELVAESDEYDYDDFNDRWSVGTPSLPPLSLSSSEESLDRDFDQSSQSDFATLAYTRSRLPVKNSTVVEIEENEVETDLPSKVNLLQRSYNALVDAMEDQRKILLRKGEVADRKERNYKKQRGKEAKLIDQRFTRLESHVITLARSVAHLSAELKSQNTIRQHVSAVQKDIYEIKSRRTNELKYLQERVRLVQTDKTSQKTVRKLRRFFGADPGHALLCNLLEELGYEEYASTFQKAKIGIMELPYTSEEQLKDIGIPNGPRKRILENIKHLY